MNKLLEVAKLWHLEVRSNMRGRFGDIDTRAAVVAAWVARAGDGDHLEIGTLWGGSAVLAAKLKKELNLKGLVWCVDPLDGYYMADKERAVSNSQINVPISPETVLENAERFGVADRIRITQARSDPLPTGLPRRFATAFIDGDHWGTAPYRDWKNVAPRTTQYVIFDNNEAEYPCVQAACKAAMCTESWQVVYDEGAVFVLGREP
jgi:hypothetical protein